MTQSAPSDLGSDWADKEKKSGRQMVSNTILEA
jgi:hypothetical protein